MSKSRRLALSKYRGTAVVFITCIAHRRHPAFVDDQVYESVLSELTSKAAGWIEITAYCLMPDHGHFLLTGLQSGSDIPAAIRRWKQATAYWYAQLKHRRLWQKNYWDEVLREGDDELRVATYVVSNPVRSGLVASLEHYRWWGSARWSRQYLADRVREQFPISPFPTA